MLSEFVIVFCILLARILNMDSCVSICPKDWYTWMLGPSYIHSLFVYQW